jgi:hypothetical protein
MRARQGVSPWAVVVGPVGEPALEAVELDQVGVHPVEQPAVLPQRVHLADHHQRGQQDRGQGDDEHRVTRADADRQQQGVGRRHGQVGHDAEGAPGAALGLRHAGGPALPVGRERDDQQGGRYEHLRAAEPGVQLEEEREQPAADGADRRGGREQPQGDPVQAAEAAERDLDEGQRADQAEGHQHEHGYGGLPLGVPRVGHPDHEIPGEDPDGDADRRRVQHEPGHDPLPALLPGHRQPQQGPEQHEDRQREADGGGQVVLLVQAAGVHHREAGVVGDPEHDQHADDGQRAPQPPGDLVQAGGERGAPAGPAGDGRADHGGHPAPDHQAVLLGVVGREQHDRKGQYGDRRDQHRSRPQPLHLPFLARRHARVIPSAVSAFPAEASSVGRWTG